MGDDPVRRRIFSKALSPRYTIALAVMCLSAAAILGGVYVAYQREMQKPEIPADTPADVKKQIRRLSSKSASRRANAARRLGEMGGKAAPAIPALIEMLDDEPEPSLLRSVFELVTMRLTDHVPLEPHREASKALGKIGQPAVEPLIATLSETDSSVRGQAATALGITGDARAVEPLIAALSDTDKNVRWRAAIALGRIGDPGAVEPLIAALEWDLPFFNPAVDALALMGELAVEPLLAALEDDNPIVRENAATALRKITDRRAVKPLIHVLGDEEPGVRAAAARALGRTGDSRAVEPLAGALKDTDSLVRACAAISMGEIDDVRVIEPLAAALDDDDPIVRVEAAVALAERRDVRAMELLIDALARDFYDAKVPESAPILTGWLMRRDAGKYDREDAAEALKNMTGQDFGFNQAKWREWWEENRDTFLEKGVEAQAAGAAGTRAQ